jgi:nicotinate-nucleotide--dimethylbenzimidazole phosphoribosyltransferase
MSGMTDQPIEPAVDPIAAMVHGIDYPDADAAHEARVRQDELVLPSGSLGRLGDLAAWVAGAQGTCPPTDFRRARLVIVAADHGVATPEVTGQPSGVVAQLVAHLLTGGGAPNVLAPLAGVGVRLADLGVDADTEPVIGEHKIRRGSGRIDREDALSADEARDAVSAGRQLADAEIDAGADLLLLAGVGTSADVSASTLVSVITDAEPVRVTGRGNGVDDDAWIAACTAIRDARRRARPHRLEVLDLLAVAGGTDLAAMTGFILQAACRRTPVLLDGLAPVTAALVAQRANVRIVRWLQIGQRSGHPAETLALERLGLEPILDLGVTAGEGCGSLLAVPTIRAAVRSLAEIASYAEAGVSRS